MEPGEQPEPGERLGRLAQLTTVPTETQVTMVIMARQETAGLRVTPVIQEVVVIQDPLVPADHEAMVGLLEAEATAANKRSKAVSLGMQTMETLVLLMET